MGEREDRDLLIRISTQLEHLGGQVAGLGERFVKVETQLADVNHRGLMQQNALERAQERIKELELCLEGDGKEPGLEDRIGDLEKRELIVRAQTKIILLIASPIYGLALIQIGRFVTQLIWGTP
jgi:hypothetical protein